MCKRSRQVTPSNVFHFVPPCWRMLHSPPILCADTLVCKAVHVCMLPQSMHMFRNDFCSACCTFWHTRLLEWIYAANRGFSIRVWKVCARFLRTLLSSCLVSFGGAYLSYNSLMQSRQGHARTLFVCFRNSLRFLVCFFLRALANRQESRGWCDVKTSVRVRLAEKRLTWTNNANTDVPRFFVLMHGS